jgi:hypothetical protein
MANWLVSRDNIASRFQSLFTKAALHLAKFRILQVQSLLCPVLSNFANGKVIGFATYRLEDGKVLIGVKAQLPFESSQFSCYLD